MNRIVSYKILDLNKQFINNIVDKAEQNDNEVEMNIYKNTNLSIRNFIIFFI